MEFESITLIILLIALGAIAALLVILFALTTVVSLMEKRYAMPFDPTPIAEPDCGSFMSAIIEEAREYGLTNWAFHRQVNRDFLAALCFAADRTILVCAGEGQLLRMSVKQLELISLMSDGQYAISSDRVSNVDVSGLVEAKGLLNADLGELLDLHTARLEADVRQVVSFTEPTASAAVSRHERDLAERTIERGRGKWTNMSQTQWRLTLKGAMVINARLFRELPGSKEQQERLKKPRPGSR